MSNEPKIYKYKTLSDIAIRFRSDLKNLDFVLLYAYNGTGKTRLSMEFKNKGKKGKNEKGDTLYFNVFTEDLFHWDNDFENDTERVLKINSESKFFRGIKELALEEKIFSYLERYSEINFDIHYEDWKIIFSKKIKNPKYRSNTEELEYIVQSHIKISRGEENIFIWCVFLAICELVIDGDETYEWVKFIYIDDPIFSLDDNNAIAVASDLSQLLQKGIGKIKVIVSSHHHLFFNVMYNELKYKKYNHKCYFLHKKGLEGHALRATDESPFFHHIALLSELKQVMYLGEIKTYHFNMLRSILEKTATFFGYDDFSKCIYGVEDEVLYARALNLLSHGKYSIYEPVDMTDDNKQLFVNILEEFLKKYEFYLPEILIEEAKPDKPFTQEETNTEQKNKVEIESVINRNRKIAREI